MKNIITNGYIQGFYCEDEKIIVNIYETASRKAQNVVLERKLYDHWCGDLIRGGIEVELLKDSQSEEIKKINCRQIKWFLTELAKIVENEENYLILNGNVQEKYLSASRIAYIVFDKENTRMRTVYFDRSQFEKNGGNVEAMSSKVIMCMDKRTEEIVKMGFVREAYLPTGIRNKADGYHFENDFA